MDELVSVCVSVHAVVCVMALVSRSAGLPSRSLNGHPLPVLAPQQACYVVG